MGRAFPVRELGVWWAVAANLQANGGRAVLPHDRQVRSKAAGTKGTKCRRAGRAVPPNPGPDPKRASPWGQVLHEGQRSGVFDFDSGACFSPRAREPKSRLRTFWIVGPEPRERLLCEGSRNENATVVQRLSYICMHIPRTGTQHHQTTQ